jgi:hypothetical protein
MYIDELSLDFGERCGIGGKFPVGICVLPTSP